MVRATIAGSADFNTISIRRGFNLERLNVAHNLSIRNAHLPGINLLGASIAGDLTLRDGVIGGWAWLENVTIGSDIFLQNTKLEHADLPAFSATERERVAAVTFVSNVYREVFNLEKSHSEVSRLIKQGSVEIDGVKIHNPKATIRLEPGQIVRLDRKHAVRIR